MGEQPPPAAGTPVGRRTVLGLIALGTRNRDIAVQLDISEFTVKRHVQNILHKLNVPSRDVAAHIYRSVFGAEGAPQFAVTV